MARLSRGRPTNVVISSDDEEEYTAVQTPESEDEISIMKLTRKRSAPSSRGGMSDDEQDDDDELIVATGNGRPGRMLMVAVEIPVARVSAAITPLTKATRQLSMDNYFGKSPGSPIVIVPSKTKRKAPVKSAASSSKTFFVRVPENRPVAKPIKNAAGRSRPASNESDKAIDEESDFAPEEESSEDDIADFVVVSEDEVQPKAEEEDDDDLEPLVAKKASSKAKVKTELKDGKPARHVSVAKPCGLVIKPRDGDLPPISDLQLIFDDIVSRIPAVTSLFGKKGGRKLRVATMCSGTESPLLALGLMGRSLQEQKLGKLELDHIFSCEIEPYKQAYIERNFKPPILFRDIRELGEDFATTAYGAKVAVPGDVDLLVAGTSCVDFSNLNTKKKTLDDIGESSDTFHGMMRWVNRHRPTIIIHENVSGAAWTQMRAEYLDAGYSAEFLTNFDTKNYYIPQTRQRGYLFAIDLKDSDLPHKWIDAMKKFRRPASCTLEAFLLPSDDPRVHQFRMDLATKRDGSKKAARSVEWEKCEGKHQKERIVERLGLKRPMTHWEEGGFSKMFDFAWQDWGHTQVDRVLDLMDINMLTQAKTGIDANYKEQFWNLSQNVDRNTFGKANGIAPCLTPHMLPYLTHRGGPLIGLEALAMQGLPINELLLTRESSQELQNLAGNAMSSTVVGTAILAALILAKDTLRPADNDDMDIDIEEADISSRISGVEELQEHPLDLSTTESLDIETLLKESKRSSRLCICEGRTDITGNKINVCQECGHTSCERCGGRPEHRYVPYAETNNRIPPLEFEHKIKSVLPMRLVVSGISLDLLNGLKDGNPEIDAKIASGDWKIFQECLNYAVKSEFRFMNLKRQQIWSATYDAPQARLELLLDPLQPEWRLFAKALATDGAKSQRRKMCQMPLARMRLVGANDPLEGRWEVCLPVRYNFPINIEGEGTLVESWEASIGLQDPQFAEKKVWDHLKISVPGDMKARLDRDISGVYRLLPTCGTASGSLHKKVDDSHSTSLFFFLDPTRTGEAKEDRFIFSISTRRYAYGEERPLVARMETKFRPSSHKGPKAFQCFTDGQWVPTNKVALAAPIGRTSKVSEGFFAIPGRNGLPVRVSNNDCTTANAVLTCRVPLQGQIEHVWPDAAWKEVDKIHERNTFESLAWLTERVRSMQHLSKWNHLDLPGDHSNCERCAPTPPNLKWIRKANRYIPREDPEQAAPYERALKNRPSPFVTQLALERSNNGEQVGIFRIGLNIPTLVHRALARLPNEGRTAKPTLSWRLTTDYIPESKVVLPPFQLSSNKRDKEYMQPPNFKLKLRPEQLRSLTWMMDQEKESAPPFIEEEISEALLTHLNWKAEGKAERPIHVRGGVLADQVGYGKTAITLGLVDSSRSSIELPSVLSGNIPVKATLIVVPPHLTSQWPSEIKKFTGDTYHMVKLATQTDLNKISIQQIMDADILVVASTLFKSDKYLSNLAGFAATNTPPVSEGRRFNAWQNIALAALKEQVNDLRDGGAEFVQSKIDERARKLENEETAEAFVQTKRLIGQAYVDAKEKAAKLGEKRKRSGTEDSEETTSGSTSARAKKTKVVTSRVEGDPWKLKSNQVRKDWRKMQAPPLEMFHFDRLVVDEYTYLKGQIHAGITCLKSKFRWVLSGTPPLDDFADVKTIAFFLGIHLGIDDDMVSRVDNRKKIKKDRTDVEAFTAFRELRSPSWHKRRQEVAQTFLNQFVRQNIAEIDEIPFEEHAVPITLPAAERAIYLELEHHLQALEMNIRKSKIKLDNDRDRRLQESLGDSASAEEALLKRCSHFVLDFTKEDEENAVQACEVIVKDRKRQLTSCREEVRQRLADCVKRHNEIPKTAFPYEDHFDTWLNTTRNSGIGDPEAGEDIIALIDQAYGVGDGPKPFGGIGPVPSFNFLTKPKGKKAKGKQEDKDEDDKNDEIPWPVAMEDKIQQLRDRTSHLRALVRKELVGRHRSLRYFKIVRDLQQFGLADFAKRNSVSNVSCPGCGKNNLPVSEIAVLSSCGHQGCWTCLESAAHRQECLTAGCDAAARVLNVVKGESLGVEDPQEGLGKHYGMKLEKVMELIQEKIPKQDKALVFVQFPDLMEKVAEVLREYKINFLQIKGTASAQSKALQAFQDSTAKDDVRVLLLNVMDESASGANLTNANHAIFLSPLLTVTDYEYRSCETQAIGRVRRYGQQKKVHVWRFLTENSIDIEIFENRSGIKFKDFPQYRF